MVNKSENSFRVTGYVTKNANVAKHGFTVVVNDEKETYLFNKVEPNKWVYVLKPKCTFSKKPRRFIVMEANGGDGVNSFFSKCIRTIEFFRMKEGGMYV